MKKMILSAFVVLMSSTQAHALNVICSVAEGNVLSSMKQYSIPVDPTLEPSKPETYVRSYAITTTQHYRIGLNVDNLNGRLSVNIVDLQFNRSFSANGAAPTVTVLFKNTSSPEQSIWVQCEM